MKKIFLSLIVATFLTLGVNTTFGYGCMEYGIMAKSNLNGTCSCISGYHFETNSFGTTQCVKDPTCMELYGWGAEDNYDGTCSCSSGYIWGTDMFGKKQCVSGNNKCKEQYGTMSSYDSYSGKCECYPGYYFGENGVLGIQCISGFNLCSNKFGYNSKFNSLTDKCECKSGYEFSEKKTGGYECKSCYSKYGLNSSYSSYSKKCECNEGYTLKNGACVAKHNSAYFYLSEYDDNDNKALVISYTTKVKYLLELRYTSGLYKAENFIGKDIVINMGTDFYIDRLDKFVLNNKSITTDIVSDILYVEEVDDSYTLKSCEDIFGENSEESYNNKCVCKEGYKWNYDKTSCEEVEESSDEDDGYNVKINTNYRDTQINKYYSLYSKSLKKKLSKVSKTKLNSINRRIGKLIVSYDNDNSLTNKEKDDKVALLLALLVIIGEILDEK